MRHYGAPQKGLRGMYVDLLKVRFFLRKRHFSARGLCAQWQASGRPGAAGFLRAIGTGKQAANMRAWTVWNLADLLRVKIEDLAAESSTQ